MLAKETCVWSFVWIWCVCMNLRQDFMVQKISLCWTNMQYHLLRYQVQYYCSTQDAKICGSPCKRAIMTLIINFIVLIAVVVRLPSYLLKVIRWDRSWQRLINYYKTYVGSHCQPRLQIIVSCNCKGCTYTWKKPWNIINILGLFILKMYIFVHTL